MVMLATEGIYKRLEHIDSTLADIVEFITEKKQREFDFGVAWIETNVELIWSVEMRDLYKTKAYFEIRDILKEMEHSTREMYLPVTETKELLDTVRHLQALAFQLRRKVEQYERELEEVYRREREQETPIVFEKLERRP